MKKDRNGNTASSNRLPLVFLVCLVLTCLWLSVLIDCIIIGAREAVWLAGGMAVVLLPILLLRKGGVCKPAQFLRRVAVIISSALHVFVIGMIAFLLIFAGTHTATGGESNTVFLLGSDMKDDRPGLLYLSRIDTARALMESDHAVELIACGGITGDNTVTEAEAARRALTENGISPDRISCEDSSTRTLDNFNFAAEILESGGEWDRHQPTAVITNRFHFYRVSRLAEAAGYDTVRLIPADGRLTVELPWTVREVLTVVKLWIVGPN